MDLWVKPPGTGGKGKEVEKSNGKGRGVRGKGKKNWEEKKGVGRFTHINC